MNNACVTDTQRPRSRPCLSKQNADESNAGKPYLFSTASATDKPKPYDSSITVMSPGPTTRPSETSAQRKSNKRSPADSAPKLAPLNSVASDPTSAPPPKTESTPAKPSPWRSRATRGYPRYPSRQPQDYDRRPVDSRNYCRMNSRNYCRVRPPAA